MDTQLLCTFCKLNDLTKTCQQISEKYQVVSNKIFILENTEEVTNVYSEEEQQLILTYNVTNADLNDVLNSTISVHRKKQTNTIYTINALNEVIKSLNNGVLDKSFQIPWEDFSNSLLVTNEKTGYTRVQTVLKEIVSTNPQYLPQKPKK